MPIRSANSLRIQLQVLSLFGSSSYTISSIRAASFSAHCEPLASLHRQTYLYLQDLGIIPYGIPGDQRGGNRRAQNHRQRKRTPHGCSSPEPQCIHVPRPRVTRGRNSKCHRRRPVRLPSALQYREVIRSLISERGTRPFVARRGFPSCERECL